MKTYIVFLKWIGLFIFIQNVSFGYQFYFQPQDHVTYHLFTAGKQNINRNALQLLSKEEKELFLTEQAYDALWRCVKSSPNGDMFFEAEYHTSTRIIGKETAYLSKNAQLLKSSFVRDKWGKFKEISLGAVYPSIRSVPLFSDKNIKIGESWDNDGIELQPFKELSYKSPFLLPFKAHYVYESNLTLSQEDFQKLVARYKVQNFNYQEELETLKNFQSGSTGKDFKHFAILSVIYRAQYQDTENPDQTAQIQKTGAVPVKKVTGFYRGFIFFNQDIRQEELSVGEYDFTYIWQNGLNYRFSGSEYGLVELMQQNQSKIDQIEKTAKKTLGKTIEVQRNKEGINVIFNDLLFSFNKTDLKSNLLPSLDKIVQLLKENPTAIVRIEGYSDDIGSQEIKQKISQGRAENVAQYLLAHGILASRVTYSGRGDSRPRVPNNSVKNRKKNRRVELHIVTQ